MVNNLQIAQFVQSVNFNSTNTMNVFYYIDFLCPEHHYKGKKF